MRLNIKFYELKFCVKNVHRSLWNRPKQISLFPVFGKSEMSTAHRRLKSSQSLSGTSAHPNMVTLANIMVMNGWLTYFSSYVYRPSHSWDKAISDFNLEISTPGSRSWVWSKGKVIQSTLYHIDSLCSHCTSIRPINHEIKLFPNLTLKHPRSRSWVRSSSHIVPSIKPMQFIFVSHQSVQPFLRYGLNSVWPWKNTSELKKKCQNKSFQQNFSKI